MIFNCLCAIFVCPFSDLFGVIRPLPSALGNFKVGDCTGVAWLEYMVELLVCIAVFLGVDELFEYGFFVIVVSKGDCSSLLMEEDRSVV